MGKWRARQDLNLQTADECFRLWLCFYLREAHRCYHSWGRSGSYPLRLIPPRAQIVDSGRNCTGYLGFYGFCRVYESSLGGTPMRATVHAAESKLMPAAARVMSLLRHQGQPLCSLALFYHYFLAGYSSPIWRNTSSSTGTAGKLSKITFSHSCFLDSPIFSATGRWENWGQISSHLQSWRCEHNRHRRVCCRWGRFCCQPDHISRSWCVRFRGF